MWTRKGRLRYAIVFTILSALGVNNVFFSDGYIKYISFLVLFVCVIFSLGNWILFFNDGDRVK